MASTFLPDAKTVVMPVSRAWVSFDSDTPRLGDTDRPPPAYHIAMSFFDALALPRIVRDADGQYRADFEQMVGFLAERWESNADATEWTVQLRRGVISHFGNELTADDVKWSWDRAYALRGVGLWRSRVVGGLPSSDGVIAADRYTVVFRLPAPKPSWPKFWAFATNCIFDATEARRHASESDPWASDFLARTPCGFGPFRLERQDAHELVGVARDDYWGGRPGIDRIVYAAVASREEAIAQFEAGAVNLIAGLYPAEFRRLERLPGVVPVIAKTNHAQIDIDWKSPPLDNQRLRQAILTAIPYERILREVYDGLARPSRGPVLDIAGDYAPDDWPYAYDPERARALVREAGAEGTEIEFAVGDDPESRQLAAIVVDALTAIGLRVTLIPQASVPPGQMKPLWLIPETSHGIAEPHYNIAHEYDPPRGMHGGRYIRDKTIVDRLRAINDHPDPAAKSAEYKRLVRDLVLLAPKVFLANLTFLLCYRDTIDPWLTSGKYAGYNNLLWAAGRSILPPRASVSHAS
ncbi:MAG: ABC transporter substrate-binding protein [Chloroflexota bacterium]|nr:ABC transporter substrate-binding protein [Dehalococcoidia bacterium]MDW8253222.1 ABC transporter substrate-binding protein [Chloroflexota bacterium]